MQLNRIMTEYVEVITLEKSIQEAARQMRSLDVGVLPVCNGDALWECSLTAMLQFELSRTGEIQRPQPWKKL